MANIAIAEDATQPKCSPQNPASSLMLATHQMLVDHMMAKA